MWIWSVNKNAMKTNLGWKNKKMMRVGKEDCLNMDNISQEVKLEQKLNEAHYYLRKKHSRQRNSKFRRVCLQIEGTLKQWPYRVVRGRREDKTLESHSRKLSRPAVLRILDNRKPLKSLMH